MVYNLMANDFITAREGKGLRTDVRRFYSPEANKGVVAGTVVVAGCLMTS
jgi:hypothetical protein